MTFDLNWYLTRGENISNFYRSPDGLGREPDPVGLYNWIFHAREEGWSDDRIRQVIWDSKEWHNIHDTKPAPAIPVYSRTQLLNIRGALNIGTHYPAEDTKFPGMPVASTNGLWNYSPEDQQKVLVDYQNRRYTHGPIGPFIDPGYHGLIPPIDFRNTDDLARVEAAIESIYAAGIIPVLFITPDGWTPEQLRTLEPIFTTPKWQAYAQIVVNGFEQQGSVYGWSNATYVAHLSWLKSVFPNAVRGLHTVSTIEAPVGMGDDTSKMGGNGGAWANLAPYIHFWLTQFDLWTADHIDPSNPDHRTDGEHWLDLWDINNENSFVRRFSPNGKWAGAASITPYPGEYYSWYMTWKGGAESVAQDWGSKAMAKGARGAFDGVH